MNDVDPQAWLADVLARFPAHPVSQVAELLPWTWKAANMHSRSFRHVRRLRHRWNILDNNDTIACDAETAVTRKAPLTNRSTGLKWTPEIRPNVKV